MKVETVKLLDDMFNWLIKENIEPNQMIEFKSDRPDVGSNVALYVLLSRFYTSKSKEDNKDLMEEIEKLKEQVKILVDDRDNYQHEYHQAESLLQRSELREKQYVEALEYQNERIKEACDFLTECIGLKITDLIAKGFISALSLKDTKTEK